MKRIVVELASGATITLEQSAAESDQTHQIGYAFDKDLLRVWNSSREPFFQSTRLIPLSQVLEVRVDSDN